MIEPRPPLVERLSAVQGRELGLSNDCAAGKPSDALERTCVLVKDWVRAEQILVPRHTPFKARNRERHVSNRRELRHLFSPLRTSWTQRMPPLWLATLREQKLSRSTSRRAN